LSPPSPQLVSPEIRRRTSLTRSSVRVLFFDWIGLPSYGFLVLIVLVLPPINQVIVELLVFTIFKSHDSPCNNLTLIWVDNINGKIFLQVVFYWIILLCCHWVCLVGLHSYHIPDSRPVKSPICLLYNNWVGNLILDICSITFCHRIVFDPGISQLLCSRSCVIKAQFLQCFINLCLMVCV
jgi:hypothetical protein